MRIRGVLPVVLAVALAAGGACSDDDGDEAPETTTTTRGNPRADGPPETVPVLPFTSSVETVTADDLPSSWRTGCPLPVGSLRLVTLSHWGFDHAVHEGRIVVADDVVDDVIAIFGEIYEAHFAIERMAPVDVYGGSDEASMDANNTSGFNCRPATGGTGWSEHAYGRAIDVNPLQNPYVRGDTVLPPQSARFADRSVVEPGVIVADGAVVDAFTRHGWIWGGTWSTLKDYQHFSPSGR